VNTILQQRIENARHGIKKEAGLRDSISKGIRKAKVSLKKAARDFKNTPKNQSEWQAYVAKGRNKVGKKYGVPPLKTPSAGTGLLEQLKGI